MYDDQRTKRDEKCSQCHSPSFEQYSRKSASALSPEERGDTASGRQACGPKAAYAATARYASCLFDLEDPPRRSFPMHEPELLLRYQRCMLVITPHVEREGGMRNAFQTRPHDKAESIRNGLFKSLHGPLAAMPFLCVGQQR